MVRKRFLEQRHSAGHAGLLVLLVAVFAFALAGCGGGNDNAATPEPSQPASSADESQQEANETEELDEGEVVFDDAGCGGCHVLAAAGSDGSSGPKLDDLKLSEQQVATQVENGGGGMPAFGDQLTDVQIQAVAAYVAQSAGQ